jgi:hypothetical protein
LLDSKITNQSDEDEYIKGREEGMLSRVENECVLLILFTRGVDSSKTTCITS